MTVGSVALGWIHPGEVKGAFMDSVLDFIDYDLKHRRVYKGDRIRAQGIYLDYQREAVAQAFIDETDCEWLMWIDSDIVFDEIAIYSLLDAADPVNRPIVSGLYVSRPNTGYFIGPTPRLAPIWYELKDDQFRLVSRLGKYDDIQKLDGFGFGFVLTHRSIYEKFPIPGPDQPSGRWFGRDVGKQGDKLHLLGEDFTFCKRAHKLGIPMFGHCGVCVRHVKEKTEDIASFVIEYQLVKGVADNKAAKFNSVINVES